KQYFQMVPLRHFRWPTSLSLTEDSQTLLVNNTILSPIATKHPPSTTYSLRFLKTLLDLIETANEEAVDSLYETYVSLLATTQSNPAFITASTICHKTYFLPSQSTEPAHITLRETEATISNGTTGLRTWEAAIRFSEYILVNPSIVSSKRVIELGAGAGLLGLVCAHMGAKSVELTDVDSGVLNLLHQNIEINFPNLSQAGKCIPTVRRLDWETVTSESIRSMEADVVVCADVVYDPSIYGLHLRCGNRVPLSCF
ncbi:Protein fam86a, partial [Rhizophlyctis rosea]